MQCLLRSFHPGIDAKSGRPLPPGHVRSGADRWARFEALVEAALDSLGFSVVRQPEHPTEPDLPGEWDLRIHAHRTRRDVAAEGLFAMQMHLATLFTLDERGWGADHSHVPEPADFADVDPAEAERHRRARLEGFLRSGVSKHAQPRGGGAARLRRWLLGPRRYVLAPLQIPRDYVQVHHGRVTIREYIDAVAEWGDRRGIPVLLKPHPYNKQDHDLLERIEHHRSRSRFVHRVEGNIHDLIAGARAVVTVNSGVGFEALVHGKPVVTFGDCDYRSVAIPTAPGELDAAWERVLAHGERERDATARFLWHYARRHAFDIERVEEDRVIERLRATIARAARIAAAPVRPPRAPSVPSEPHGAGENGHRPIELVGSHAPAGRWGALRGRIEAAVRRELAAGLGEEGPRVRYWRSRGRHLIERVRGGRVEADFADLLIVIPAASRGWILDAIGRELAARFPGRSVVGGRLDDLPRARNVWFAHHSFVPTALAHNPHLWGARRATLFTHDRELPWEWSELAWVLDRCHRVIAMNEADRRRLEQRGVDPRRLRVGIPGVDTERFRPGPLGDAIGFCAAYYPRKAPERVLAVARAFPERRILLLGPGWERWDRYGELAALANFERLELPYERYPEFYRRLRVFVSPSRIEGGPMPLLEALCSAVPVAASRTGFAPDLVREGVDGVLFDAAASEAGAIAAVARALELPPVGDPPARRCTWERFAGIVAGAWRVPRTAGIGSGRSEA